MRPPHMVDPQTLRQQRLEAVGVAWQRNGHIVAHEVIADQRASRNKGAARWEDPVAIGLEIRAGRIAPDQSYQNYVVPDFVNERCRHRHATLSYPLSRSLRFFSVSKVCPASTGQPSPANNRPGQKKCKVCLKQPHSTPSKSPGRQKKGNHKSVGCKQRTQDG